MPALRDNRVLQAASLFLLLTGIVLLGINLYGLTQSIRKPDLGLGDPRELRFVPEQVWSYEESMRQVEALSLIPDRDEVVKQSVYVVNQALVHPDWFRVDPIEYRQLIPLWENYFLHFMGRVSELPQYERYHFANYRRSIQRGIGMCGDASMVLSSILDTLDVDNRIISFDGHVIVEYQAADGSWRLADPDFGVLLSADLAQLVEDENLARQDYLAAGFKADEVDFLLKSYATRYAVFDDTYHFMTKRYIFEYASYALKWIVPIAMIVLALWYQMRQTFGQRREQQKQNHDG